MMSASRRKFGSGQNGQSEMYSTTWSGMEHRHQCEGGIFSARESLNIDREKLRMVDRDLARNHSSNCPVGISSLGVTQNWISNLVYIGDFCVTSLLNSELGYKVY